MSPMNLPRGVQELVFPEELFHPERVERPAADDGVVANARLTALSGAVLVVLFSAVGVTLLDTRGLIDWHAGIGIASAVVVTGKLASTAYRFARYYRRDGRYVASGPPRLPMRVLAPLLVLATVAVIVTGIVTIYEPTALWLTLHKGSFIAWIGLAALHVGVYVWRLPKVVGAPRGNRRRATGSPVLTVTIVLAVVVLATLVAAWFVAAMPALPDGGIAH